MTDPVLLVHNAMLITMAPGQDKPFTGWLAVDDLGKIVRVEAGDRPAGIAAEAEIDAKGAFVAPGFISAHSHLATSGSRGLGHERLEQPRVLSGQYTPTKFHLPPGREHAGLPPPLLQRVHPGATHVIPLGELFRRQSRIRILQHA